MSGLEPQSNIFRGKLVRLTAEDPKTSAEAFSHWDRDSEYQRLMDTEQVELWSVKKFTGWREKNLEEQPPNDYFFHLRILEDDQLIGFTGLSGIQWQHGSAWAEIGIGERKAWGKGYGTDAMRVLLRYGFTELNLHRVSLGVFAYNPRAIRSYEKVGFHLEGHEREVLHRDGSYTDVLLMGILREEWERSER